MIKISAKNLTWLEDAARSELKGCRRIANDGTVCFTPDGVGNYGALWTRDFAYMVPLFDLFDPKEVRQSIHYLVEGQRGDGIVPDRRQTDGLSVYEAGGVGHPVALPPLDNSAFLVLLAHEYVTQANDIAFFKETAFALHWAMQAIPRSAKGLVWNHPTMPHSPYGFTDTVGKTGDLLFCSLLDWKASKALVSLFKQIGNAHRSILYQRRMKEIEAGVQTLLDPSTGLYFAASKDCRQIDVWGNAFMAAIGFPLDDERRERIERFFVDRYDDVIERGQIRHLPKGEHWNRMLIPIKPGVYQNGGYWGTPTGWVLKTLAENHPATAQRILDEIIEDYQNRGIHEWVNGSHVQLPHYVASITNLLAVIRLLG